MSILGNSPKFSSISWSNAENVSDTSVWGCSSDSTASQNIVFLIYRGGDKTILEVCCNGSILEIETCQFQLTD
jgi:hypothetical protein